MHVSPDSADRHINMWRIDRLMDRQTNNSGEEVNQMYQSASADATHK